MTEAFDAVLFDIDGTICEYDRPGTEILPFAFSEVGVEPFFTAREYLEQYPKFVTRGADVRSIREQIFVQFADERKQDPTIGKEIAEVYARERDHRNVSFLPGAFETISEITNSYSTGIVTNGSPEMQQTKLDSLEVRHLFEPVIYAGYDTPAKPDPTPFETALSDLGTEPEKTLYVGNSLDADVRGAKNAGVPVAWLSNGQENPNPVPDYRINTLNELLEIV